MIYIDTDLLVNTFITQDEEKHRESIKILEEINQNNLGKISTLSVQETLFVLDRLKLNKTKIIMVFDELMALNPLTYDNLILNRAVEIAKRLEFRQINDCIHTAIAESFCDEIITYNKKDFSKIKSLTKIKVRIL